MMSQDERLRKLKPLMIAAVIVGVLFAFFFGDQISSFEDGILTALFGPRP